MYFTLRCGKLCRFLVSNFLFLKDIILKIYEGILLLITLSGSLWSIASNDSKSSSWLSFLEEVLLILSDIAKTGLHWINFSLFLNRPLHCKGSVPIWSDSGPHSPAFGLNMERYRVSLRIQSECKKILTWITTNAGTYAVVYAWS